MTAPTPLLCPVRGRLPQPRWSALVDVFFPMAMVIQAAGCGAPAKPAPAAHSATGASAEVPAPATSAAAPAPESSRSGPPPEELPAAAVATPAPAPPPATGRWDKPQRVSGTVDGVKMTGSMLVYLPSGYGADPDRKYPLVLALHGWNDSPAMLRDNSDLEGLADRYGLVLAIPAMGKTVYETQFYPESSRKWGAIPGARWVAEVVLPQVRKRYAVATDRAHTAVVGYSTGGRGAVLLAEAYPEFAFAGSLSGTFDLMRLDPEDGEYKIHAVIYGPHDKFKDRWERDNCVAPARLGKLGGTRLFLGHGDKDPVVKPDQLSALAEALTGYPKVEAEIVTGVGGGHDWAYWNSGWPPMFASLASALNAAR